MECGRAVVWFLVDVVVEAELARLVAARPVESVFVDVLEGPPAAVVVVEHTLEAFEDTLVGFVRA